MCIVQGLASQACLLQTSIVIYGSTSLYIAVMQIRRAVRQAGFRICRTYAVRDAKCLPKISETSGYFTFLLHTLSIKITPSPILNRASTVAKLPQLTQYFVFPL